jgi:hypothetical protein
VVVELLGITESGRCEVVGARCRPRTFEELAVAEKYVCGPASLDTRWAKIGSSKTTVGTGLASKRNWKPRDAGEVANQLPGDVDDPTAIRREVAAIEADVAVWREGRIAWFGTPRYWLDWIRVEEATSVGV